MRQIIVSSIRPVAGHILGKDIDEYLKYIGTYLDIAGERKSDIACLPETFADQGEFAEQAEIVPGPISSYMMHKAKGHNMYVIGSLIEKLGTKKYNTALIIGRDGGIVGKYHKTHLVPGTEVEKMGLSIGDNLPVFDTDCGKIGAMICFDGMFPEVAAVLARKGAEIIFYLHQMNSPDPYAYQLHVRARAMDNCVYVVTSTTGVKSGQAWSPITRYHTYIVGRDGEIIAGSGHEEGVVTAAIDLDKKWWVNGYAEVGIHDMRRILLKHRRPGLYRREGASE